MILTKNLKGKIVAEFSVTEFSKIYKQGVSRQNILQLIGRNTLPEGVTSYKLGENYVIQSTRQEHISLLAKK